MRFSLKKEQPLPPIIYIRHDPWRAIVDFSDKNGSYYGYLDKQGRWSIYNCTGHEKTYCASKREAIGRVKKHFNVSKIDRPYSFFPWVNLHITSRKEVEEYQLKNRTIRFLKRALNKINAKYHAN